MAVYEVAFLGPIGTYSHLVAEKRFGTGHKMVPLPTVLDVCTYVAANPERRGIVPIENSSGGAIYETIDILLADRPSVQILEELSLNVKLALLGIKGEKIKYLYSHFAPLEHCVDWINRNLAGVEKRVVASTASAAQHAAAVRNATALGSRKLAALYDLQIIKFPVQADIVNLTMFLAIGGRRRIQPEGTKTTLAVKLPNVPGSLCTLLEAFRGENVNLSRIISRPIRGCPREYAFLVDIAGKPSAPPVRRALARARKTCVELRTVGCYPCRTTYKS